MATQACVNLTDTYQNRKTVEKKDVRITRKHVIHPFDMVGHAFYTLAI